MPIRQRVKTYPDFPEKLEIHANPEALKARAADARGVFDPASDPFPASDIDQLGVEKADARAAAVLLAFTTKVQPTPKQMRVQDLLARLRMPYSPADNVERVYRQRIRSPLTAIRAFCVLCAGGPRAATECDKVECVLWPFHRGKNSMRTRK